MARRGQPFNEYLDDYKKTATPEDLAEFSGKLEHFELVNSLIERRKDLHMSQTDLADTSGLSQPEISRIESGATNPTVGTLVKLARGLQSRIRLDPND